MLAPPQLSPRRLAFMDFWPGFATNTDRWFCQAWFARHLPQLQLVEPSEEPHVVLFTLFGTEHRSALLQGSSAKFVFFTGENVRPPVGKVPLCISFDHLEAVPPSLHSRLPLWIFNEELHDVLRLHEQRLRGGEELEAAVAAAQQRPGFCSFVASNSTLHLARWRIEFVKALSARYKQVACGGQVLNNIGGPVEDKMAFLKSSRFHVAFENQSHAGYCTEKVLHAFAAGCVPIYWGDPNQSLELGTQLADFNPMAVISAHDFKSADELIQHIAKVDADDELFASYLRQPILSDRWYARLRDWPRFCHGFAELLFQDCERGTPPLPPPPPRS